MLRAADFRHCDSCRRGTPHDRRGRCMLCATRVRRARRAARRSVAGSPLETFGALQRAADRLWSVWVRAHYDHCEMCLAPMAPEGQGLQCAHGWSRQDRPIRYDPDNLFALCAADHRRNTPPRADWWEWVALHLRFRLGDDAGARAYARLELAARGRGRVNSLSLRAAIADAQQRIGLLPAGPRQSWACEKEREILTSLSGFTGDQ